MSQTPEEQQAAADDAVSTDEVYDSDPGLTPADNQEETEEGELADEGETLAPEEVQPETQGESPEDAREGPEGQGDLDPTAYAEQEEQEQLDEASMHETTLDE